MNEKVKGLSSVARSLVKTIDSLDPLSMFAMEKKDTPQPTPTTKTVASMDDFSPEPFARSSRVEVPYNPENDRKAGEDLSDTPPQDEVTIKFLTGEQKIMSLVDASIQTVPGQFLMVTLFMTNYRIVFIPKNKELKDFGAMNPSIHSWLQIPLASIDRIEREKKSKENTSVGVNIIITCKDCRIHRITAKSKNTQNGDYDIERAVSVLSTYTFPNNMRYLFAFTHSMSNNGRLLKPVPLYDAAIEFSRLGVLDSPLWRVSNANREYKLCNTYPQFLVVPKNISDDELFIISNFRSGHRLPALCWANSKTGASMWRSSQPKAGVSGSCMQDEKILDHLAKSCVYNIKGSIPLLYIVDLRSRASAMANRAAGAGYESQANYPSSRLEFYNIPNIHGVRDSHKAMMSVVLNISANASSDINFSKQIEETSWLTNIRLILKASWETAAMQSKGYPVLVHCSHGWDRTAQVCAVSQLLLDPFYRTMDGFKVLIEKEWIAFGHPFQMRLGHGQDKQTRQEDQISPIFLQFLDTVWQIWKQHGQYFEFNARYLLTIADHIYSGRFGTFLFSNDYDRDLYSSRVQCTDIWTYLHYNRKIFMNPLYMHLQMNKKQVEASVISNHALLLPPITQLLRNVTLWSDYWFRWSSVPSAMIAPTILSKQVYSHGLCVPLFAPLNEDELEYSEGNTPGSNKSLLSVSGADLDVLPIVASDDFWDGAYRLERDRRIKLESSLEQSKQQNKTLIAKFKTLMAEKNTDIAEDDWLALLESCNDDTISNSGGDVVTSGSNVDLQDTVDVDVDENIFRYSTLNLDEDVRDAIFGLPTDDVGNIGGGRSSEGSKSPVSRPGSTAISKGSGGDGPQFLV